MPQVVSVQARFILCACSQELRVKGSYLHHKTIRAAMGVKIAAHNLESAVAGTQVGLLVCMWRLALWCGS